MDKMSILIVDDNATNLLLLTAMGEAAVGRRPVGFDDPTAALNWCEHGQPDLILVDFMMPHLNGHDFIRLVRQIPHCADVPIVMVTTENSKPVREEALRLGATEFLSKPVDSTEFKMRVRNLLALRKARNLLNDRAALLQHEVDKAVAVVVERERELVLRLARAAEFRDPETGGHIARMAQYAALIAAELGLDAGFQRLLLLAAPMHDVGKLATPDAILLKPGRLTEDELRVMRRHAEIGADILSGSAAPLLQLAEQIARHHHERYDGGGYPAGLRGDAIPLAARIVAVADVFDALTSARPYKAAWPLERARAFLTGGRGSHFCPRSVDAFLGAWPQVALIQAQFHD